MQETESGLAAIRSRSLAARGGLAVVLAVLANVVVVLVAGALGVAPGFQPLSIQPVALFSAVGALGAVVVYALLRRLVDRPNRTFTLVAAVVLVLSFVPDLWLLSADPAATVAGVLTLMLMHVVVAGICVALLAGGLGR